MLIHTHKEKVSWLEFDIFQPYRKKFQHAIFLRRGGVSAAPYDGFNLAAHVGDDPEAVHENQRVVQKIFGNTPLYFCNQVHGNRVVEVMESFDAKEADAMVSSTPNLTLAVHHADCQAAIIYDPVKHVVANIHCGWRGNVENIYKEAIDTMRHRYGSNPSNLLVGISPSLGPDDAEFLNYHRELSETFWPHKVKECHFDLWAVSRDQLEESGVLSENIQVAEISTFSNPEDYFSFRRNRITGRHATCVRLL